MLPYDEELTKNYVVVMCNGAALGMLLVLLPSVSRYLPTILRNTRIHTQNLE
jgi:hypothetical protein